ncbi:MAG: tetratricopeptide repeat protein [Armatimonadetes bacterium]|nr:tetratricopeptide repeat protein [Armatimonadota bacterium]
MGQTDLISSSQALLDEAKQFMEQNHWQQAEERFKQVARKLARKSLRSENVKPLLTKALTGWARCLIEKGQLPDAIKIARRALSIMPSYEEAQNLFLNALVGLGKWQEAIRQVKRWLKRQKENWKLHLWAARIDAQLENWTDAIQHLALALRLSGNQAEPYEVAAQILERKGETKRALLLLKKGIEQIPDSPALWFTLGQLQRNLGKFREALESFEQVLKLGHDTPIVREVMGQICSEIGLIDKALEHVLKGLEQDPESPNLLDLLSFIYLQKGLTREALQVMQRLVRIAPTDPVIQFKLATLHHQVGNYAQAVMAYQRTIALALGTELAKEAQQILEVLDRHQLEQVFMLSMEDPIFRTKLIRNPQEALLEKGFLLSESSLEVIHNTDFSQMPKRHGTPQRFVS